MNHSYQLRNITERTTLADGTVLNAGQYGPPINAQYPLGKYLEDYEYVPGLGTLDEHNGRNCSTPEYPAGTYAYFMSVDEEMNSVYPYTLGATYYGTVQPGNTGPQSGHNNPGPNEEVETYTPVSVPEAGHVTSHLVRILAGMKCGSPLTCWWMRLRGSVQRVDSFAHTRCMLLLVV